MTVKQIEIIRLALDTPEANKYYVKHCTDAKLILNLLQDKLEGDIENSLSDVEEKDQADENIPLFNESPEKTLLSEQLEKYWDSAEYLLNTRDSELIGMTKIKPEVKPVFLGRIGDETPEEEYLALLEDFIEDLPAYTVKFVYNDSKETVFEIIK
jgi:hypothetical protein